MPGLDVSSLSSNWKKLQQTLKAAPNKDGEQDQGLKKRKRDGDAAGAKPRNNPHSTGGDVKRVKTGYIKNYKPGDKKKMGMGNSKISSNEKNAQPPAKVVAVEEADGAVAQPQKPSGRPSTSSSGESLVNQGLHPTHKPGKYLALDCEMVGTGPPPSNDNILARVSIVNYHGEQVYDSFVQPLPGVEVTDYRTFVSGIRPQHLRADVARPFSEVQQEVAKLLEGKVLVGHALRNDLAVLLLSHPKRDIRDTARHANFRKTSMGRTPALRKLAKDYLGMEIQGGEHSSVEDARATMLLFKLEKDVFEKEVTQRYGAAIRREQKAKQDEAKQAIKTLPKYVDEESDEEDEEEDDEDEVEEGTSAQGKGTANKKKRKKKKRTKRA